MTLRTHRIACYPDYSKICIECAEVEWKKAVSGTRLDKISTAGLDDGNLETDALEGGGFRGRRTDMPLLRAYANPLCPHHTDHMPWTRAGSRPSIYRCTKIS